MTEQILDFNESPGTEGSTLYGVTNRSNLLEILGSGIAKPREGYAKYYGDLLEEVPGHIPVSREAIAADVADLVSSEPGQFPILFAFDSSGLSVEGGTNSFPWVALRVIPVSHFRELCFRNDIELQEFLARQYENVPVDSVPCRADPGLFAGQVANLDSFREWKESLPEAGPSAERIALADKLGGAYNMLAQILPPTRDWFEWLAREISGDNPSDPIASVEAGIRHKAAGRETVVLTALIMRTLARIPAHDGFDPEAVLSSVETQISELPAKERRPALESLGVVRQAISGETDLESIEFAFEDRLFRALTLTLLRPEPTRFMSWKLLDLRSFRDAAPQAAVFVGLTVGYTATPVDRRGDQSFQSTLSTLIASLVAGSRGPARPALRVDELHGRLRITLLDEPIIQTNIDELTELLRLDLGQEPGLSMAVSLDRALELGSVRSRVVLKSGWELRQKDLDQEIELTVEGHLDVSVELDDQRFRDAVVKRETSNVNRVLTELKQVSQQTEG